MTTTYTPTPERSTPDIRPTNGDPVNEAQFRDWLDQIYDSIEWHNVSFDMSNTYELFSLTPPAVPAAEDLTFNVTSQGALVQNSRSKEFYPNITFVMPTPVNLPATVDIVLDYVEGNRIVIQSSSGSIAFVARGTFTGYRIQLSTTDGLSWGLVGITSHSDETGNLFNLPTLGNPATNFTYDMTANGLDADHVEIGELRGDVRIMLRENWRKMSFRVKTVDTTALLTFVDPDNIPLTDGTYTWNGVAGSVDTTFNIDSGGTNGERVVTSVTKNASATPINRLVTTQGGLVSLDPLRDIGWAPSGTVTTTTVVSLPSTPGFPGQRMYVSVTDIDPSPVSVVINNFFSSSSPTGGVITLGDSFSSFPKEVYEFVCDGTYWYRTTSNASVSLSSLETRVTDIETKDVSSHSTFISSTATVPQDIPSGVPTQVTLSSSGTSTGPFSFPAVPVPSFQFDGTAATRISVNVEAITTRCRLYLRVGGVDVINRSILDPTEEDRQITINWMGTVAPGTVVELWAERTSGLTGTFNISALTMTAQGVFTP